MTDKYAHLRNLAENYAALSKAEEDHVISTLYERVSDDIEGAIIAMRAAEDANLVQKDGRAAELGQEVGAVADGAALLVRDVCEMAPADPDAPDTVCIRVSDLTRIAELYTSPAHTSEARDACKAKYLPKGSMIFGDQDYETTKPCFEVVHRGCRYYMSPTSKQSIARLNEQDAAMRQEGGRG